MNGRVRRGIASASGAVCIGLAAPARPALAQSGEVPARECCLELLFTIGGRALALGDAVAARTSPGSLFVNPATLANVHEDQLVVHNADTSIEKSNTFSVIVRSEVAGTFGLSYRLVDYGDQEATDINMIPTGTVSTLAHVLTASYSTSVMSGLNAGVSYKLYQFRQDCRGFCNEATGFSATTHGLDLGVQYLPAALPALQLGAAVTHLGFALQVVNSEQASTMPVRLRAGAAYEAGHHFVADSAIAVWTSADMVVNPHDGRTYLNVGVDLSLDQTIFLRGGYGGGGGLTGGAAAGVGIRYGRFDVDVAKSFVSSPVDESDPAQISFAVHF